MVLFLDGHWFNLEQQEALFPLIWGVALFIVDSTFGAKH